MIQKLVAGILAVLFLGTVFMAKGQEPDAATLKALASAEMIFRGTVRLRFSATVSADDVSHLAIVRLNEVTAGPPALKAFQGKDITVELKHPEEVKDNQQRLFFARSWQLGKALA